MDLTSQYGLKALESFNKELEPLHGDELLKKKIEFDSQPKPKQDEKDLRLHQGLALEAKLVSEFGLGKWQAALKNYNDKGKES